MANPNPAPTDEIPFAANFSAETDSQVTPAQPAQSTQPAGQPADNQPIEADPEVCCPILSL